jgi:Tol biopolymer transport system component
VKRKGFNVTWVIALSSLLSSCAGYPQVLNFPYDPGGRSLNSPTSELTPQIAASRYIAFVSDRNGSQDVYLFDALSRGLIDLPGLNSLNEIASHPSVSQDGRYLVFAASSNGKSEIYLYDRETQQKRSISTKIAAEVRNPTISADGNKIAFEVATDGQWDIYVCDRSGEPLDLPGIPR